MDGRINQHVAETAAWLDTLKWQFYGTLTLPFPVSRDGALAYLRRFTNSLERALKCNVAYAGAMETRHYSGCGMVASRPHFHLLMSVERLVTPEFIQKAWSGYVGRGQNRTALGGPAQDSADVRLYTPGGGAAPYCLKTLDDVGDWFYWNLEMVSHLDENSVQYRRMQRHSQRVHRLWPESALVSLPPSSTRTTNRIYASRSHSGETYKSQSPIRLGPRRRG